MNLFNNVGMQKKMILIYIIAIFMPVVTFGILYLQRTRETVKEQSVAQLTSEMEQAAQQMDFLFFSVEEVAGLLAYDKDLTAKLNRQYDLWLDVRDTYTELWNQYANLLGNWSYIRNVTLYADNLKLITSRPFLVNTQDYLKDTKEEEWIRNAQAKGYWSGVKEVPENREYWYPGSESEEQTERSFAYSRVMGQNYSRYSPQGILVIEIYEEEIKERLHLDQQEGDLYLLDAVGNVILSTSEKVQPEQLPGFGEKIRADDSEWNGNVVEDDEMIATYQRLNNGWRLIGSLSVNEAMAPQGKLFMTGMWFLIGATVVSVGLILLFSVSYSNRMKRMVERMEDFMDGSFELMPPIGGKDEIGRADAQFTVLAGKLVENINEQYVMKLEREKSKLEVLQAQVNPHFLYNALSTIGWLADKDHSEATRHAVESLAKFYQINLSKGKDTIVFSKELECLEAYLEIQKMRYPGRIFAYFDLDPVLANIKIPKLTVQALVENSIQHGMAGERETISIFIRSAQEEGKACISIQDDGLGMKEEQLEALRSGEVQSAQGNGIGYRNVHRRIQLHFGEEYGLKIKSRAGEGTIVKIYLPI